MLLRELARGVYAILARLGDPLGDSNFGLIVNWQPVCIRKIYGEMD